MMSFIFRLNPGILWIFELESMKLKSESFRLWSFKNHLKWYQTRINFLRSDRKFKLLRGRLGRWTSLDKLLTKTKKGTRKFYIFWYQWRHRGLKGKYGFEWKTDQNLELREFKLRGLRQNQISTLISTYQIDRNNKVNTISDFENETPTHMDFAHENSKFEQKFQNRIPREFYPNLDILSTSVVHWISSIFFELAKSLTQKIKPVLNPEIQPIHTINQIKFHLISKHINIKIFWCVFIFSKNILFRILT